MRHMDKPDCEEPTTERIAASGPTPEDAVARATVVGAAEELLATGAGLRTWEREVVGRRLDGEEFEALGAERGVSKQAAQQLHRAALGRAHKWVMSLPVDQIRILQEAAAA